MDQKQSSLEKMVNISFWKNKKVLITGFNGFKGSWMSLFLAKQKATLFGYSLKNSENLKNEKLFQLKKIFKKICHNDIRNKKQFSNFINITKPDIIFHFAAQSIVINSYKNPNENFETNFNGLLNLLENTKKKNITNIIITSDKCYLNQDRKQSFKENDSLGGDDPYSASKAIAEILCHSYKKTFNMRIATLRGGNVIGGADWNKYRIVNDIINSMFQNKKFYFRNPGQTRPWQHVIDVVWNYAKIAELTHKKKIKADCWNIAPKKSYSNTYLVKQFQKYKKFDVLYKKNKFLEKKNLSLNSQKLKLIGLTNFWQIKRSVEETYNWFDEYYSKKNILSFSHKQIDKYLHEKKGNIKKN